MEGRLSVQNLGNINIVSIAVDASQDTISELTGKIGKLDGISVKTAYSNKIFND